MSQTKQSRRDLSANLYVDTDESGDPRIVANTPELPAATDPVARHARRVLEAL
jgi:hypothetical protein